MNTSDELLNSYTRIMHKITDIISDEQDLIKVREAVNSEIGPASVRYQTFGWNKPYVRKRYG